LLVRLIEQRRTWPEGAIASQGTLHGKCVRRGTRRKLLFEKTGIKKGNREKNRKKLHEWEVAEGGETIGKLVVTRAWEQGSISYGTYLLGKEYGAELKKKDRHAGKITKTLK